MGREREGGWRECRKWNWNWTIVTEIKHSSGNLDIIRPAIWYLLTMVMRFIHPHQTVINPSMAQHPKDIKQHRHHIILVVPYCLINFLFRVFLLYNAPFLLYCRAVDPDLMYSGTQLGYSLIQSLGWCCVSMFSETVYVLNDGYLYNFQREGPLRKYLFCTLPCFTLGQAPAAQWRDHCY